MHGFTNPDATAKGKQFGLPIAYDAASRSGVVADAARDAARIVSLSARRRGACLGPWPMLGYADMQKAASTDRDLAEMFKAVADPTRVRILATILATGELCVCHVEAALGITQSRASRHLTTLRRAGLIADRRDGTWVHYGVPRRPDAMVRSILATVRKAMVDDAEIAALADRAVSLRDGSACGGGGR